MIEVTTLYEFVRQKNISRIDMIKMDIQGGEGFALEGMQVILKRFSPMLLIEFSPFHLRHADYDPQSMLCNLKFLGYALYEINYDGELCSIDNVDVFSNKFIKNSFTNIFCKK